MFFCFFLFLLALAFSQVQRSQCLLEAYVFWHTFFFFSFVFFLQLSVNCAGTRTYSTVGMRSGMREAKQKLEGRSLSIHHGPKTKESLRNSCISVVVVVVVVGGGEHWNYNLDPSRKRNICVFFFFL